MPADAPPGRILFFAPNFLCHRLHKKMRGVEVFDLILVRQMVEMGCDLTVAAERTWRRRFDEHLAGAMPKVVWTPSLHLKKPVVNATLAAAACLGRRFDVLLVGNTARGLLPAVSVLLRTNVVPRGLVFANREPTEAFVRGIADRPIDVLAVSEAVAAPFRGRIRGLIGVYYGLPNAEAFFPREEAPAAAGPVNFCLLGMLDSPDKGAPQVMEAFLALPTDVRARCRLHLASYRDPPRDLPEGIIAHEWMPADRVPAFLRTMDVLVIHSKVESFSQAMVQAMLTSLPVIVPPIDTLTEKLDAGGGIVFRSRRELVEAMATLARDPALRRRLGDEGRQTALSRYVWDTGRFVREYLFPAVRAETRAG